MDYKLITCILTGHKSKGIIEKLSKEKGIITANKSTSRGTSLSNINGEEMEVITVLVESNKADEVFEYLFFEADLNSAHHGMIYQEKIKRASTYTLPKDKEEKV